MKIGTTLADDAYLASPGADFQIIKNAGFSSIALDLAAFYLSPERKKQLSLAKMTAEKKTFFTFEEDLTRLKSFFLPYKTASAQNHLPVPQMRAPRFDLTDPSSAVSSFLKRAENCLALCAWIGCPSLVLDLPQSQSSRSDWETAESFILPLLGSAKKQAVEIRLTNQVYPYQGRFLRGLFSDPGSAASCIDRINRWVGEKRVSFFFRMENSILSGQDPYEVISCLGPRIGSVGISDCDGVRPQHVLPFSATQNGKQRSTDWPGFVRGLRECRFGGPFFMESTGSLCCFPTALRSSVLHLMKETGDFLCGQIEISAALERSDTIVTFGAGRMFTHYMESFGKTYRPLFTVDNAPNLKGTCRHGIEIRSPGSLLSLPENALVVICSQFYGEIESQLADMGVRNTLIFHDEYRPVTGGEERR